MDMKSIRPIGSSSPLSNTILPTMLVASLVGGSNVLADPGSCSSKSAPVTAPVAATCVSADKTAANVAVPEGAPAVGTGVRLVGSDIEVRQEGKYFRSGRFIVNEHLPAGYPAPTPPGAIEIKSYPSVRRAEFSGEKAAHDGRGSRGFWPLFGHIVKRDIAMTAPVEMDYAGIDLASMPEAANAPVALPDDAEAKKGWQADRKQPLDAAAQKIQDASWTMSFLYRTSDLGPTGEDGKIKIVDTAPVTVISVGLIGSPSNKLVNEGMTKLREYFASQTEWAPAGEIRGLFYNGPDIAENRKWAEIQVPVRRNVEPKAGAVPVVALPTQKP
jgi:hypothetical protein